MDFWYNMDFMVQTWIPSEIRTMTSRLWEITPQLQDDIWKNHSISHNLVNIQDEQYKSNHKFILNYYTYSVKILNFMWWWLNQLLWRHHPIPLTVAPPRIIAPPKVVQINFSSPLGITKYIEIVHHSDNWSTIKIRSFKNQNIHVLKKLTKHFANLASN